MGTVRRAAGSDTIAEKCVSFLQPVFKLTRSTPTLLLFTAVWHCTFARLQEMHAPYGTKVAKALQRHYFEQVPTDTVKEVYGVKSWPGMTQALHGVHLGGPGLIACSRARLLALRHKKVGIGGSSKLTSTICIRLCVHSWIPWEASVAMPFLI